MSLAFDVQHHFAAPPERVFAGLTDLDAAREWMQGFVRIEKLTDGPFGVGTVWRETRKMFGREATEEFDVTEVDAPRRLGLHVDGTKGSSRKGEYRFVYVLTPATAAPMSPCTARSTGWGGSAGSSGRC